MTTFDDSVVQAVLTHMNDDHADDSLLIVRAFADPQATTATMVGLDATAGRWTAEVEDTTTAVEVPWPIEVTERADLRKAVVVLYEQACERLDVEPRGH